LKPKRNKISKTYLNSLGLVNALGSNQAQVVDNLNNGFAPGMKQKKSKIMGKIHYCGVVEDDLPRVPQQYSNFNCRNNQLALAAIQQIEKDIDKVKKCYGAERVGLVIGTSTSGIQEAEQAIQEKEQKGTLPNFFDYKMQELGAMAEFLGLYLEISGPCYSISTACSSSGKVFASAKRLLESDICDAVIVGGADSLCDLTLGGFDSLEAVSFEQTQPFSENRKGINIGEGAAMFLMTKEKKIGSCDNYLEEDNPIILLGVGETGDAYHMSAPEPNGKGAIAAMECALNEAELKPENIDYINLHGTGTKLNDAMEARAIKQLFGQKAVCSSTKPFTGHTLGAAGATEVAICWILLNCSEKKLLAPHVYDGNYDKEIDEINLASDSFSNNKILTTMSNSFAFGGNNVSVILGLE